MMRFLCFGLAYGVLALFIASGSSLTASAADQTLRVGTFGAPPGLGNPYKGAWRPGVYTWAAIFDGLTLVDGDGNPTPALALNWENVSPTTWRIVLRDNVSFQNGEPLNAEAVAATVSYAVSEEGAATPTGRIFRGYSAKVINEHTVEIATAEPDPIVPNVLAALRVLAPRAWADLGDEGFSKEPVGTGPFRLTKWTGGSASMEAFSQSWRAPRLGHLEVIDLPERAARLDAFLSGQIDIMIAPSPDDFERIRAAGHKIHTGTTTQATAVALILHGSSVHPAIRDKRVRQALNFAVDKEAIVRALYGGLSSVASQPVPPGAFGYDPSIEPYGYDPERARQLLAEAGYADGFDMVIEFYGDEGDMYQRIAEDLSRVGINAEIKSNAFQAAVKKFLGNSWEGHAFRHVLTVAPQMDAIRAMGANSCLKNNPWYCNDSITPLIAQANEEFDPAKREQILQHLMRIYHEEAPVIYLLNNPEVNAVSSQVQGFENVNSVMAYQAMSLEP